MAEDATQPEEWSTASPGAVLKRCREFHAITLEEASETTKIGMPHLRALEEDRIGEFANLVYLKGFLRIYAVYLGLNADDMTRIYDKLYGNSGESGNDRHLPAERRRSGLRLQFLKKLIFPVFLLLALLVTATFFKPPPSTPVQQPSPSTVSSATPPPLPVSAAVQAPRSSAQALPLISAPDPLKRENKNVPSPVSEQLPVKKPPENVPGFILKIRAVQNGKLTATVDGSAGQNYELATGDIIEWKAVKIITLELSNAGGVEVEFNGKPYKSLGPPGKPAYVELDADGIKP